MKLFLLELNEINFEAIRHYIRSGISLPGFERIIKEGLLTTKAEEKYEELEPWIQWPSVHTGKTANEHKVFRLGDFVNSEEQQLFEKIEKSGYRVGAVSPMNASNQLMSPAYFIPDPWTKTLADNSFFSKAVASAVSQAVNDNSQSKLTALSIIKLCISFVFLVDPKRFFSMIYYAVNSRGKSWRKALFLDMLLYEFHKTLFRRKNPEFTTLFLNAGAHIQHHYFFNSSFVKSELKNPEWYVDESDDPFLEMLFVYDSMLQDIRKIPDTEIIVATGLSQKPYEKLKFYYRLKNHEEFLNDIGVSFSKVIPRMSRDFLIIFDTDYECSIAQEKLSNVFVDKNTRLFGEIDNRGKELFVVLTYPHEIKSGITFNINEKVSLLSDHVAFVAIKNGEHQSKGFAFFSQGVAKHAPEDGSHVSKIHNTILSYFGISS
ncbi:MAG: hypothetical protein CMM56_09640 [Rhodospirillaceae bacterium]|nr:hypothetical protein [Rhodospirillaceae bacterium]